QLDISAMLKAAYVDNACRENSNSTVVFGSVYSEAHYNLLSNSEPIDSEYSDTLIAFFSSLDANVWILLLITYFLIAFTLTILFGSWWKKKFKQFSLHKLISSGCSNLHLLLSPL